MIENCDCLAQPSFQIFWFISVVVFGWVGYMIGKQSPKIEKEEKDMNEQDV